MKKSVYRGRIDSLNGNIITVSMLDGYNYGQKQIAFHTNDAQTENKDMLKPGAFAEIIYDGRLSPSLPPQGNAEKIYVIAPFSHGVIVNGKIKTAENRGESFFITMCPFNSENEILLIVPADALEEIDENYLVANAEISAVTRGISTMSIPAQMPVHVLLPYISFKIC